jgi:hypothetical protein
MTELEFQAGHQRRAVILTVGAMLVFYVAIRFTFNWLGLPRVVGTATFLGVSLIVFFLFYFRNARREARRLQYANRVCPRCEYPLNATSGNCPECGTPFTMPEVLAHWDAIEDMARGTKGSRFRDPDEN